MHDFFLDLDSDLLGTGSTPSLPKTPASPRLPDAFRKPAAASGKHAPKRKPAPGKSPSAPPEHITLMRSQMMEFWVIVVVFRVDEKTRALLGNLRLETRWFAHPDEVREVHKMIIKRARASYEDTVKDIPDIEEKDLLKIIRRDLELFLQSRLERNPVVIPMIFFS